MNTSQSVGQPKKRRSLMYIRLAAYLAGQPPNVNQVALTIREIEGLLEAPLPANARFPSWWRNDKRRMHSRAWITAGWEVTDVAAADGPVRFSRRGLTKGS